MKEIIRLVVVLTAICAVCSALLAAVYKTTETPIAQSLERRTAAAAAQVMPPGCDTPEKRTAEDVTFFAAKKDGKIAGVALEGFSKNGYGGDVRLMVGLGMDGKLVTFEVIQATETPGLGSKMSSDAFRNPIKGRRLAGNWQVKKDGGEVDAITAATISSRAALECIRDAIAKFDRIKDELE